MTIDTFNEVIIVPHEIIETLIQLKRLLILYKGVSNNEEHIIRLLITKIEQISEEGKGNLFIETLISEYNYPRHFDQEEVNESFYVEPFFRFPITIGI